MTEAKTLKVGICSLEDYKARTLKIARGEKMSPALEPKVWFDSVESFARVLSEQNRALLALIAQTHPESLSDLAVKSGRAKSNLSRTLKTMEKYGLVHLEAGPKRQLVPQVNYARVALEMSFDHSL